MGEIKDIVTCVLTEDFLNLSNDDVVFHQLCSISEEYELFNVDVRLQMDIFLKF